MAAKETASFNIEGGAVTERGKIVYQDGRPLTKYGDSNSAEAQSIADSYNSQRTRHLAMSDSAEVMGMQAEFGEQMARSSFELAQEGIDRNIERFPEFTKLAQDATFQTAASLNAYMQDAYNSALDDLYPEWRDEMVGGATGSHRDILALTEQFKTKVLPGALKAIDEISTQALSNVNAQLRGEIDPDVAAQLKRHAAEISQQIGVRGQAAQFLTARDLGRTAYDIKQQGLANAPGVLGLATGAYGDLATLLQAPVASGINVTNLLSGYRAPMADAQQLYGSHLGIASSSGLVPAGQMLATGAQTMLGAAQIAGETYTNSLSNILQTNMNIESRHQTQLALDAQKKQSKFDNWMSIGNLAVGATGAGAKVGAALL